MWNIFGWAWEVIHWGKVYWNKGRGEPPIRRLSRMVTEIRGLEALGAILNLF
jgi:hypothetical protein